MFRITAYYGQNTVVSTVTVAEDIQAATINADLAFHDAGLIVVEVL